MWALRRIRAWVKQNCIEFDSARSGDVNYLLTVYFDKIGKRKRNVKSSILVLEQYDDPESPIYKGNKDLKVSIKKGRVRKGDYSDYLRSNRWRTFKKKIIKARGRICELCKKTCDRLDLHHKTYDRLYLRLQSYFC